VSGPILSLQEAIAASAAIAKKPMRRFMVLFLSNQGCLSLLRYAVWEGYFLYTTNFKKIKLALKIGKYIYINFVLILKFLVN